MASFGNVQIPQNPLLSYSQIQQQGAAADLTAAAAAGKLVENQAGEQDLSDRATLRGLAGGLTTRDPGAVATASTLGPLGTGSVNSLSTIDHNTAADKLALATFGRTQISFPGLTGGAGGVGGAPAAAGVDPTASGAAGSSFGQQLGQTESGNNPSVVNKQGFAGQFQFGTARLADLGLYQPAPGESMKVNQWTGQLNIPGFADVKTLNDFRNNPDAQRAAFAQHMDKIDHTIAATPGADKMDQNGLRAVAHLGGEQGMQRFVQSGGAYNPADANGTHLSDYYRKFAQGGRTAFQASFGHPDGRLPAPASAGAQAAPAAPVQMASNAGATGMPQTATDAMPVSGGMAPQAAPTGQGAGVPVGAGVQNPNPLLAVAGNAPASPPNVLSALGVPADGAASPAAPMAPAPTSQPTQAAAPQKAVQPSAPAAAAAPSQAATQANTGLPPGAVFARDGTGQFITHGMQPGYALAGVPDGKGGITTIAAPIPGTARDLEFKQVGDQMLGIDKRTGQVVSKVETPNSGRLISVPRADGGHDLVSSTGKTVMSAPPDFSARQDQAYTRDIPRQADLISSLQSNQAQQLRQNEIAEVAAGLATGPTAELRAKGAAYLESMGVAPETIQRWTGMSSGSQAQELVKLGITAAGGAAKETAGANTGIGSISLYQSANPGMMLLPDANKRVTNMMRVGTQASIDYAQGALSHFDQNATSFTQPGGTGVYKPLASYDAGWAKQANPQIYAGAMGILNGDPAEKWGARLSADQKQAAMDVAKRVDPNVGAAPAQVAPRAVPAAPAVGTVEGGHRFLGGDPSKPASWQRVQ